MSAGTATGQAGRRRSRLRAALDASVPVSAVVVLVFGVHAPTTPSGPTDPGRPVRGGEVAALRRGVVAEAVLGVAVLAVTAALVNTAPARASYAPPFTRMRRCDTRT